MKKLLFLLLIVLFPVVCDAATHYVSNGASGSWADSTNRATPCSYATANASADDGDTVIFIADGGVFSSSSPIIQPANSGSSGNYITFQSEIKGTTELRGTGSEQGVIDLKYKSYIVIDGFLVRSGGSSGWIDLRNSLDLGKSSSYITIQNCTFRYGATQTSGKYGGIYISGYCSYISVLDNDIGDQYGSSFSHNDLIHAKAYGGTLEYLLFQGNTMVGGSHSSLSCGYNSGTHRYIVIRNNTINNPNHRCLEIYNSGGLGLYYLVENNILKNAGSECSLATCYENVYGSASDIEKERWMHFGTQFNSYYSIFRKNIIYNCGSGMMEAVHMSQYNRHYNNVYYKNGLGYHINSTLDGAITENRHKNEVYADNNLSVNLTSYHVKYIATASSPCNNHWINNNFDGEPSANPVYWDDCANSIGDETITSIESTIPLKWYDNLTVSSGFTNKTGYDFTLAAGSSLIDAGGWLTTTSGSGTNSTTLIVADARYFTNGYGLITGDTIQIEGRAATAIISSISSNTITLATPLTWLNGEGVSLAYSGNAPDIGAYEYTATTPPSATGCTISGGVFK